MSAPDPEPALELCGLACGPAASSAALEAAVDAFLRAHPELPGTSIHAAAVLARHGWQR